MSKSQAIVDFSTCSLGALFDQNSKTMEAAKNVYIGYPVIYICPAYNNSIYFPIILEGSMGKYSSNCILEMFTQEDWCLLLKIAQLDLGQASDVFHLDWS